MVTEPTPDDYKPLSIEEVRHEIECRERYNYCTCPACQLRWRELTAFKMLLKAYETTEDYFPMYTEVEAYLHGQRDARHSIRRAVFGDE